MCTILINISVSTMTSLWIQQQYGTQPDKFMMTEKQHKLALVHGHHLAFGLVCFDMRVTLRAGRRQRKGRENTTM